MIMKMKFLGFDLDNIEEAEERYIRQLDVLNDFDSNIEFSEMGVSDKEEIDSDVDWLGTNFCLVLPQCFHAYLFV
jgi:hypothetical protein